MILALDRKDDDNRLKRDAKLEVGGLTPAGRMRKIYEEVLKKRCEGAGRINSGDAQVRVNGGKHRGNKRIMCPYGLSELAQKCFK